MSGIATVRAAGLIDGLFLLWMEAWMTSWIIAFPAVLVIAPVTRKIAQRLMTSERRS
ncbi:MAG: DUF2798 domain-containing protein [Pseudomonadota bacterium]